MDSFYTIHSIQRKTLETMENSLIKVRIEFHYLFDFLLERIFKHIDVLKLFNSIFLFLDTKTSDSFLFDFHTIIFCLVMDG